MTGENNLEKWGSKVVSVKPLSEQILLVYLEDDTEIILKKEEKTLLIKQDDEAAISFLLADGAQHGGFPRVTFSRGGKIIFEGNIFESAISKKG